MVNGSKARQASHISFGERTSESALKRWLGSSKVVDADGKPLLMYHGTNSVFGEFDLRKTGENHYQGQHAFHFISEKNSADNYAIIAARKGGDAITMAVHLRLINPKIIKATDRYAAVEHYDDNISADIFSYQADGYDGVLIKYDKGVFAVAFFPDQIKIVLPELQIHPSETPASSRVHMLEMATSDPIETDLMLDFAASQCCEGHTGRKWFDLNDEEKTFWRSEVRTQAQEWFAEVAHKTEKQNERESQLDDSQMI